MSERTAVDREARWGREAFRLAARDGWSAFGSHVDQMAVELEFDGKGEDGLPIWERPVRPVVDRAELAKIAHGEPHLLGRDPIATVPSPWQAVEDALDRLLSSGHVTRARIADRAEERDRVELIAWCTRHDSDARTCGCPEGQYELDHDDCSMVGTTCIAYHVPISSHKFVNPATGADHAG